MKKTIVFLHFCGDDGTAELVLRTIISINQLSINGALANMCDELTCRISGCSESEENARLVVNYGQIASETNDKVQGKSLHDLRTKIAQIVHIIFNDQTVLQCRYHEDRCEGIVFHDPRRCGTEQIAQAHVQSVSSLRSQLQHPK